MKPIKGMSIEDIEPYREEKKNIYGKLAETILISSFNYLNDYAKFMIGLNATLITAYFAVLKLSKVKLGILNAAPFFLQLITIMLFLLTSVHPRI